MTRDGRLIVGAVGISALGDFLLWIPLTLHVHEQTGSGAAVAALMICLWGPIVLLAPAAGLLADRVETRRLLLWASRGAGGGRRGAGAHAGLDGGDARPGGAARRRLRRRPAGRVRARPGDRRRQLNGPVEAARYAGMAAGPVLGGALAAAGGTEAAVLVDAASFALVALAAGLLRARRQPHPEAQGERARDGIVLLFRDRTLAVVIATVLVSLLFMSASIAAEVVFIKDDLGASGIAYGAIFSSWMLGMVLGALVVSRRVRAGALAGAALVAVAVQGAGLGLPTVWLAAGFGAAMFFTGGIGHGVKNVLTRALIQERVPGRYHGRAFAAYNGMRNGAELVALAWGGVLVVTIGARGTLALAGAISVLAALGGLLIYAGSLRAPARPPAGPPRVPDAVSPAAQRSAG